MSERYEEILDLVDKDDNVISTINRVEGDSAQSLERGGYLRAAELFIMNSEGKLWIPIRTADKKIAPNGFDYSAAGHVESGDNYVETMIRETEEELNIQLTEDQLEIVAVERSELTGYIHTIYLLRRDEAPNYNLSDFTSASWLTPEELIEQIDAGHPTKMSLRGNVILLQDYIQVRHN